MKITDAKVLVCCRAGILSLLKIYTDEVGIWPWGCDAEWPETAGWLVLNRPCRPACRVYPRSTEWQRTSCSTSLRRKGCRRRMSGLVRNIFCTSPSGTRSHLLHDVHHRLTPIEAARLGKSLEPYALAAR